MSCAVHCASKCLLVVVSLPLFHTTLTLSYIYSCAILRCQLFPSSEKFREYVGIFICHVKTTEVQQKKQHTKSSSNLLARISFPLLCGMILLRWWKFFLTCQMHSIILNAIGIAYPLPLEICQCVWGLIFSLLCFSTLCCSLLFNVSVAIVCYPMCISSMKVLWLKCFLCRKYEMQCIYVMLLL